MCWSNYPREGIDGGNCPCDEGKKLDSEPRRTKASLNTAIVNADVDSLKTNHVEFEDECKSVTK